MRSKLIFLILLFITFSLTFILHINVSNYFKIFFYEIFLFALAKFLILIILNMMNRLDKFLS